MSYLDGRTATLHLDRMNDTCDLHGCDARAITTVGDELACSAHVTDVCIHPGVFCTGSVESTYFCHTCRSVVMGWDL